MLCYLMTCVLCLIGLHLASCAPQGKSVLVSGDSFNQSKIPIFASKRTYYEALAGDPISLTCEFENLDDGVIIVWKTSNHNFLSAGALKVTPDPRISLEVTGNKYTLTIKDVRRADEGDYICLASADPLVEEFHHVEVMMSPKVKKHPSSGVVVVNSGDDVEMKCLGIGRPLPEITWKKQNGVRKMYEVGDILLLERVSREDAGEYTCTAENGFGQPATDYFEVKVRYPPEITSHKTWIHTGEGYAAEISCHVFANPHPTIRWMKGMDDVRPSYKTKFTADNTYSLIIGKIKESDFGTYTCVAENALGATQKTFYLSGLPSDVDLVEDQSIINDELGHHIVWRVESVAPILEYSVEFGKLVKLMNDSMEDVLSWRHMKVPADRTSSVIHTKSVDLQGLDIKSSYEVKIQARNKFGWNRKPLIFRISTTGYSPLVTVVPNYDFPDIESQPMISKSSKVIASTISLGILVFLYLYCTSCL